MKKNIGSIERVIRIVAGGGILSLAFVGPQSPWAYLGIVPLATRLAGWCPPYALPARAANNGCFYEDEKFSALRPDNAGTDLKMKGRASVPAF